MIDPTFPEPHEPWVWGEGWQFELWWPIEGKVTLVKMTLDREAFRRDLDERLAAEPDAQYQIMVSSGWDVYGPMRAGDIDWSLPRRPSALRRALRRVVKSVSHD